MTVETQNNIEYKYLITVDPREKDSRTTNRPIINNLIASYADLEVEIKTLDVGDYIIWGERGTLVLERKATLDFAASIRSKRLWEQLKGLKFVEKEYGFKVGLLMEGNIVDIFKVTDWKKESIIGVLNTIVESWDIKFYLSPARRMTHIVLYNLAKKYGTKPGEERNYPKRPSASKRMSIAEKALYLVQGFPNIGGKRSIIVMKEIGSIKNLIEKPELLLDIRGFKKGGMVEELNKIINYDFKNIDDDIESENEKENDLAE